MSEPNKLPVGTDETTPGDAGVRVGAGDATSRDNVRNVAGAVGTGHDPHDIDVPGAEAVSIRAGHEPDKFGVKSILAVPALLAVMVLLSFGIVTAVFFGLYTRYLPTPAGGENPQKLAVNTVAEADGSNRRDRDVSDRFSRIGSTAPKDVEGVPGTAVPQPRLEYLKQTEKETPDDPAFERSKRPVDSNTNTYEIRPEDLRPENYFDPVTREKVLVSYGWVDPAKKVARVPIAEAMRMALASKTVFKARKDLLPSPRNSINTPTLSNGGRPPGTNGTSESGGPTPPPPPPVHPDAVKH